MANEWLEWIKSNVLELIILILVLSLFINTFYRSAEKEAPVAMEKPEVQEKPMDNTVEEPPTQTQEIAVTEPKAEEKST